jgi:ABC-2 type transport system permease protein
VLLYGQMIGRSVVKEKLSKTVDVMLSSVLPKQLLFGKILGIGAAGILQYAFWILVAAGLIGFLGPAFDISLPEAINLTNFLYMAAFFITAYFLYASAYAALGSAAEDEQHLGQLAWPLLLFLIVPLVMISPIVMNPSSTLIRVLSLFPMSSPLVMLVRVLVEPPPAWELILCFALLLVAIYLFATLAAKIFRTGILMTGKRPTIGEIVRWVK